MSRTPFDRSCVCVLRHRRFLAAVLVVITMVCTVGSATAQQRARPPKFDPQDVSRVFFTDVKDAFRGDRPTLAGLRQSAANVAKESASDATNDSEGPGDKWSKIISPLSLEDEVKRVKLRYDSVITTPGAFNGGGYQDARLNLSVLASLFAIISKYDGDVRWKKDAISARDLIARTARNCAAGSTQVYNEAKLRKTDLQDIVSGGGLAGAKDAEEENDWSMIVDRSPMMEYAEELLDSLTDVTNNAASAKENASDVVRRAELLALVGEILVQEGLDDADDEDYASLSRTMTTASRGVVAAVQRQDFDAVREAVGAITQSCSDCHEQYR